MNETCYIPGVLSHGEQKLMDDIATAVAKARLRHLPRDAIDRVLLAAAVGMQRADDCVADRFCQTVQQKIDEGRTR